MKLIKLNLRSRIYISMMALILISLLATGIITINYFSSQNKQYHSERLKRKEKTIISSLQYFFNDISLQENMDFVRKDFDYKIKELSDVNGLEINIFTLDGKSLLSSELDHNNPTYYTYKIDSSLLNKLKISNKRQVKELDNNFISTYSYIKNKNDKNIAIINIPYNTSEYSDKNALNPFLLSLLEINILLFIGASIIAFLLSNYITKSLRVISEKLKLVEINKKNDAINWDSDDEIGALVKEYNKMINQLEESATKLAKSERESAWREMAKQVAHEIKNPLTPIKLSVQHLERSLKPDTPNFNERLNKFSKNIISQIDTLSTIASEFSQFASMPKLELTTVDLITLINSNIELFKSVDNFNIDFNSNKLSQANIKGDKQQMQRVLNNLTTNSIQSFDNNSNGCITISLKENKEKYLIEIKDNGSGIPDELKEKIFHPNFTTKSTGAGLGLAMVKQIIDFHNGTIYFKSSGEGTSFFIELPILLEKS